LAPLTSSHPAASAAGWARRLRMVLIAIGGGEVAADELHLVLRS
jgi:hypothetical protein